MYSELHYKVGLSFLFGIGPKKATQLVSKLGSPEAVFMEKIRVLRAATGIRNSVLANLKRQEALDKASEQLEFVSKNNINVHFFLDANYPRRLKQCEDAPIVLYSMGNFEINPKRTLAIVGTRNISDYGRMLCGELVESLGGQGVQVISGLAYGIDIFAHRACVNSSIQTIGVMGHGLDRIYPHTHRKTAVQMLENGGLITEFVSGTNPDRENFPMRNRIVAGMADAVVVVESRKKGGSLITAELANDYSKDVFAYPGSIGLKNSEGCHYLIAEDKAHLITSGRDLLQKMGWEQKTKTQTMIPVELTPLEIQICTYLESNGMRHPDEISMSTGIPISELQGLLLHLELKGIVRNVPGRGFQKMG
ncbi:MAG: DNA-protecting protein DprA [Bacteroidota bacterium]